jgi:type IV secretion system protein VirD4
MKGFNAPQATFMAGVTLGVGWVLGSFLLFVSYNLMMKGMSPLGGVLKAISQWQVATLWHTLTGGESTTELRILAGASLGAGCLTALLLPLAALIKLNQTPKAKVFGDARFATDQDIRASRSVTWGEAGKGIVVGKYKGKLLRYVQPDFVSISAGTRAGKGAAVVIPNLMEWLGSLLVLDLKQECFNITSKYRQQVLGNQVFLINPFSDKTHCFNPLHYVDLTTHQGSVDLMGVAEIFYPTDTVSGAEKHFNEAAQSLFIAMVKALYLLIRFEPSALDNCEVKQIFSIGTAVDLYHRLGTEDLIAALKELREHLEGDKLDGVALDAIDKLGSFMGLGDEARGSVIGTFEKEMKLFSLPPFRAATDRNDFDFRDMRRQKTTIYLGILPSEVKIAGTFLNLFFTTAIKVQLGENPDFDPSLKHQVLMLMDEFPAFGRVNYVKDSAGYIAGYKLQLLTISQSVSQHQENYGDKGAESLMYNHPCKIVYATSDMKNAEYYANEIGYVTDRSRSDSKTNNKGSVTRGESASETKRHLILPQEIKTLPDNQEVILLKGEPSIRCEKAYYFNDRTMMDRLIALSPTLSNIQQNLGTNRFPSKEQLALALTQGELEASLFNKESAT